MHADATSRPVLMDGSRLVIEAMARAGADAFIGYPITPANNLYRHACERMPFMLPAPDEITTVQWMAGLALTGRVPVTATSFPGFALMIESINMAFMMELPMVIVLVQRLGPATGTATCGAQGDLLLVRGTISGGHPIPVFAVSDFGDAWNLAARSVEVAVRLRTPVILLTSKEEMMTTKSFDPASLPEIEPAPRPLYDAPEPYRTYGAAPGGVPAFLPVGNDRHQVRYNASTHDDRGALHHSSDAALANTRRLETKILSSLPSFTDYEFDGAEGARTLVVAYGITAAAARDAVAELRLAGRPVSLLVPKTLLPTPPEYLEILQAHDRVVVAEETMNAQFAELLFGRRRPPSVRVVGALGHMITPAEIAGEVEA